jgi:hypothetical protein
VHRFAAPWARSLTVTTALAVALLLGLVLFLPGIGLLSQDPEDGPALLRLIPIGLLGVLALTWALSPRGFAIEGSDLLLERRLGALRIPLRTITAVGPLGALPRSGTLRYAGTSGLFGYFGRFWSPGLGRFRLHATRLTGLVLVDTEQGRWVLSPEPPEPFVAALRRAVPRAAEPSAPDPGVDQPGRGRRVAVAVALGLAALAVGGIFVAITGFTPVGVRITEAAIVVERRWFADVEIPLSGVRGAEALPPGSRRGWRRTMGTSLPGGVAYGRFSSSALGTFQVYAWRGGPLVKLETTDGPVVLTPDDPEAFLADVRARLR